MATQRRKDDRGRVLKEGEYQRANGTYRYRWVDKSRREHSIYAKTLDLLRIEEEKILKDTLDGIATGCKLTLNDMYERWRMLKRGLKENTFRNYQYMYETFVKPKFGKIYLQDIKKSDVRAFYVYLHEVRRLKFSTIDSVNTVIHQVFDVAVGDEYIRYNPSADAMKELRRSMDEEIHEVRALTVEEQEAFEYTLSHDPRHKRWHPIFTTLLWTGMRVGEITGLRWCDIDFKKNLISVNHTLVYYDKGKDHGGCSYAINTPKTKAGCRMIPMMPAVVEALKEEKEYQELEDVTCTVTVDGYTDFVFLNRFGGVLNQGTLNKAIDRIERDHNMDVIKRDKKNEVLLPPLTNHWLRHTFSTRMMEAGMHPKALQEILGHKDISITMNIYTNASTDFTSQEMAKYTKKRAEKDT